MKKGRAVEAEREKGTEAERQGEGKRRGVEPGRERKGRGVEAGRQGGAESKRGWVKREK